MDMRDFTRRPDRSARLRRVAALFPLALAAVLGACEGSNLFGDDGSAIGAPVVKLEAPDSATTGGVVDLKIQASSERRVAGIDVRLRVAMQRDTTLIISPPRSSVNEIFSFQVGEDAIAGPLVVMVSARDDAGSVGRSTHLPSASNFQPWYTQRSPHSSLRPKNIGARRCGQ